MFDRLRARVVPFKISMAIGKVDVFLVEDGSPLKRRSYSQSSR